MCSVTVSLFGSLTGEVHSELGGRFGRSQRVVEASSSCISGWLNHKRKYPGHSIETGPAPFGVTNFFFPSDAAQLEMHTQCSRSLSLSGIIFVSLAIPDNS